MKHKKTLKVGAFQFLGSNDINANLEAIERGIKFAAKKKVRLLLTQECALCGYPPVEVKSITAINKTQQQDAFNRIIGLSIQYNMFIALGMITFDKKVNYNSVYMINPNSRKIKPYHKRALWGWDAWNFTPGKDAGCIYNINGIKVGVRICYEAQFPEYFRELFRKQADLCIVSFAYTGPVKRNSRYDIEKAQLISRAVENAMYILSSNSLSHNQLAPTCLIDPDGEILGIAPKNKESLLAAEIKIEKPNFSRRGRILQSKMLTKP